MKKILAILVLVLFGTMSYAQWGGGPTVGDIWNTNSGNVCVGNGSSFTSSAKFNMQVSTPATMFLETTLPASTLGVQGQFRLINKTTGHIFNNVLRYFNNGSSNNYEMLQSLYDPTASKWCEFLYFNFTNHKFEFRDGITDGEFRNVGNVYFNNNPFNTGSVGIGVNAIPDGVKLLVNGKVVCKEVEVTLSSTFFPDYVFNDDYKLRSLYDVENFINQNKHLPDVPSAKEVGENGLNLGNMNATLLQKVEELTLYMIQLKKENDALKARVSSLEK